MAVLRQGCPQKESEPLGALSAFIGRLYRRETVQQSIAARHPGPCERTGEGGQQARPPAAEDALTQTVIPQMGSPETEAGRKEAQRGKLQGKEK